MLLARIVLVLPVFLLLVSVTAVVCVCVMPLVSVGAFTHSAAFRELS
jgi:hypothetical protein